MCSVKKWHSYNRKENWHRVYRSLFRLRFSSVLSFLYFVKDHCRALLRDGRGAAFVCTPSVGELMPFQECVIQVTGYSDMWGEYKDSLICKVCYILN